MAIAASTKIKLIKRLNQAERKSYFDYEFYESILGKIIENPATATPPKPNFGSDNKLY
jgi:hypothetical protein